MENMDYGNSAMGKALTITISMGQEGNGEEHQLVTNPGIKMAHAESMFVEAMHEIVEMHGKLADDDGNGIYVGYKQPSENKEKAARGIMCGNCAFYCPMEKNCHIITIKVKPGGLCRLAAIGQGLVKEEK